MTTDSQLGFKISRQQRQQLAVAKASQRVPYYQATIQITGDINADKLHQVLTRLAQSHEIFHTRFEDDNRLGEPLQKLAPESAAILWTVAENAIPENYVPAFAVNFEASQSNALIDAVFLSGKSAGTPATLKLSLSAMIADHHSMDLLLAEMVQALSSNEPQEDVVQYVDFAEWQDEVVDDDEPAKAFWGTVDLEHFDFPRLPQKVEPQLAVTSEEDEYVFTPAFELQMTLNEEETSAQLLAIWNTALQRFSGVEQTTCLVHFHGRVSDDFATALGAYSRWIPLSLQIRDEITGAQLQDHINMQLAQLDSNQMSLPLLAGESFIKGVGFELLPPLSKAESAGIKLELLDEFVMNDGTDIKLSCRIVDGKCQSRIGFNKVIYQSEFIEVLVQSVQTIAANWQADNPVKQQIIVAKAQQMAALHKEAKYPLDTNVVTLIENAAASSGHHTAIEWDGGRLNYAELNKKANQLAHTLISKGIGPGQSVGLCFERGAELSICMLAVLKTGAAFIGLDPQTPPQRLQTILEEADLLLIAQALNKSGLLGDWNGSLISIDPDLRDYSDQFDANPLTDIAPESCAYLLYTSGSTGKPKGVQVTHQGLNNYLQHATDTYLQNAEGAIVHTSIGFDLTITGLLAPLIVGKKVFMVPDSMGMEVLTDAVMGQSEKMMLKLTPAHLKALNPWFSGLQEPLPLDVLVVGGEALYGKDIAVCRERFPELKIYNEYGPTEATVGCSIYLCDDLGADGDIVPIGHPVSGTDLYILDPQGQALPLFCSGELYIGGLGLAAGYMNMPEVTADRFVALELPGKLPGDLPEGASGEVPSQGKQRLYKTGDVVRLEDTDKAGLIYLGRNDNQIKIRGYRIELGEIEAVLKSRLQVQDVVITTRNNKFGDPEIVAYLETTEAMTAEAMQQDITGVLPNYMHPAHVVCLERFPLTPNGKIDTAALPDVDTQKEIVKEPYVAPTNEIEQHLVDAYQAALAIDQVGIKDHFFALGGDSIRAVHVVSIANEHGYELKVEELFNNPSVEALSQLVVEKQARKAVEEASLMSSLLDELEGLSEEEVAERLSELEEEQPK